MSERSRTGAPQEWHVLVCERSFTKGASVGRKQGWDQTEVLASAMRLFRRRGYLGASVRDLEEATGLHPGSLYRAFKNKDELFRAALDAYNDQVVEKRVQTHLREPTDAMA